MKTTLENKWVKKLISDLELENIFYFKDDEEVNVFDFNGKIIGKRNLDNIVFKKDSKKIKIHNDIFFRKSGMCATIEKNKDDDFYREIPITDEFFYELQKSIILYCLNNQK
jgi:hypothetical protein